MICRRPDCPCRPLPWIALCALCVLDLGSTLGFVPGDPASDDEVFDAPEDEAAAYPEGRP